MFLICSHWPTETGANPRNFRLVQKKATQILNWRVQKTLHRVIREEKAIFWEMILSVVVIKRVHMNTCLIVNGFTEIELW